MIRPAWRMTMRAGLNSAIAGRGYPQTLSRPAAGGTGRGFIDGPTLSQISSRSRLPRRLESHAAGGGPIESSQAVSRLTHSTFLLPHMEGAGTKSPATFHPRVQLTECRISQTGQRPSPKFLASFIAGPAVTETSDAFAPCAVASGLQTRSHERLNRFRAETIQIPYRVKTHVIAERHLDDLAFC